MSVAAPPTDANPVDLAGDSESVSAKALGSDVDQSGEASSNATTLADVAIGTPADIRAVGGERAFRRRLMELGLLPGTGVEVLRVAPLGDPIQLRVRGGCLSIRRADAQAIVVSVPEVGS